MEYRVLERNFQMLKVWYINDIVFIVCIWAVPVPDTETQKVPFTTFVAFVSSVDQEQTAQNVQSNHW